MTGDGERKTKRNKKSTCIERIMGYNMIPGANHSTLYFLGSQHSPKHSFIHQVYYEPVFGNGGGWGIWMVQIRLDWKSKMPCSTPSGDGAPAHTSGVKPKVVTR